MPNNEFQIDGVNSVVDVYRLLRRLPYKVQTALYEYVDNSIQSYSNKVKQLRKAGVKDFEIEITFHRAENKIEIIDNAGGMDRADMIRAFKIGTPPPDPTGLSEFGVGLKGASQWFAGRWTVETKAIGEEEKFFIEIDDSKMSKDQTEVNATSEPNQPINDSYTVITLYDLVRKVNSGQMTNALEMIGATYKRHIEAGFVKINLIDYDKNDVKTAKDWFLQKQGKDNAVIPFEMNIGGNKQPLEKSFTLTIDDGLGRKSENPQDNSVKIVKGKAIIYVPGTAKKAGVHYFRKQRIVKGGRPVAGVNLGGEKIYSIYNAPNSFMSQRLYIECDFDDWPISVDKSEIIFEGDSRVIFEEKLMKALKDGNDFIDLCKTAGREEDSNESGPTEADIDDTSQTINTDEFDMQIQNVSTQVDAAPVPIVLEDTVQMSEVIGENKPNLVLKGNDISFSSCEIYYVNNRTQSDPYCYWTFDLSTKKTVVALNRKHPYVVSLGKDRSRLVEFLVHLWIDAFVQNNLKMKDDDRAGFFLKIKDQYLRQLVNLDIPQ